LFIAASWASTCAVASGAQSGAVRQFDTVTARSCASAVKAIRA
jgi:hypothetical protein